MQINSENNIVIMQKGKMEKGVSCSSLIAGFIIFANNHFNMHVIELKKVCI
jgi:hypothetical protein